MTIVITMAGLGSRFKKAGYRLPKYQISVHGHTLFDWSMQSIRGFLPASKICFIVRKEDNAAAFIRSECKKFAMEPTIIEIDYLTSGQAETALLAKSKWNPEEPLLIYNIDTYVEAFQMKTADICGDGWIPCFPGEGDHWSFVKLDAQGRAIEVREKQRISDHCTVGAYYFRSASLYETLYREYYLSGKYAVDAGERYVAPLYNYLIQEKKGDVRIYELPKSVVHVLGTPEEVNAFEKEFSAK